MKTAYVFHINDGSSDVCSSDLRRGGDQTQRDQTVKPPSMRHGCALLSHEPRAPRSHFAALARASCLPGGGSDDVLETTGTRSTLRVGDPHAPCVHSRAGSPEAGAAPVLPGRSETRRVGKESV